MTDVTTNTPVFVLGGLQRCGQHCVNNYLHAAYDKGAFKNDAPAHNPCSEEGAYTIVPFSKGMQRSTWENSPLPKGVTQAILESRNCISLGIENFIFSVEWAEKLQSHFQQVPILPRQIYFIQVVRSPLNNIASMCKMWGAKGRIPDDSNKTYSLHHTNQIPLVTRLCLDNHNWDKGGTIESWGESKKINYIKYDDFVSNETYRKNFYSSLPNPTETFMTPEKVLLSKVQLSSFDEGTDFNKRYLQMADDPTFQALLSPELQQLNDEFVASERAHIT